MQRSYAVHSATNTIDILLEKGANKLYQTYLNQKLPDHCHQLNHHTFTANLELQQVRDPLPNALQTVPVGAVPTAPIDPHAPKRILLKRNSPFSTLSPKNSASLKNNTFSKTTHYQTFRSNRPSLLTHPEPQNSSLVFEQPPAELSLLSARKERPLTMQGNRKTGAEGRGVEGEEEKRAATCHVRNRKKFVSRQEKMAKMVRIREDNFVSKEEAEVAEKFKRHRIDKLQEQMELERQQANIDAYYALKERRAKEHFEDLKAKLQGKHKESPGISNFENSNGEMLINGRPKQQRTHIIQLEFNPEQERTLKTHEPKVTGVNTTKKTSFVAKMKKKLKITNEEYTNNGQRQISCIPFINLSCGIALSESILEATASRRRPTDEVSREQFTTGNSTQRFKSHIPIVNEARIAAFATIQVQTARSCLEGERKDFLETTLDSRKEAGSLLWRPRAKSLSKGIRISNRQAYHQQILESKLVQ